MSQTTQNHATQFTPKQLAFAGASLALALFISTFIKLPSLPLGGSATLFSMLLVCLIGYWYGPKVGIVSAFAYGILQFIVGPYVVHPAQVILDFPLAFGALGLSGFFYQKKHGLVLGYLAGTLGRYVIHCISGVIFYTEYVGNTQGNIAAITAGLVYNLTYMLPEILVTLLLLMIPAVSATLNHLKQMAQA